MAPTIKVKKGDLNVFQIGGPGGGIEANATLYYVGPPSPEGLTVFKASE